MAVTPPRADLARRCDLPGVNIHRRGRPGMRTGRHAGEGTEILAARPYVTGDDAKRVDWNASARTGELHVKSTIGETSLNVTIVVDTSASMRTGSARRKIDTALDAAAFITEMLRSYGERPRVAFSSAAGAVALPARGPFAALATLAPEPVWGDTSSIAAAVHDAAAYGYVVAISDLFCGDEAAAAISAAAARGGALLIEIVDPTEVELPDAGAVRLVDPESGAVLTVNTGDRRLRTRWNELIAQQIAGRAAELKACGGHTATVRTDEEVSAALASQLPRRR